MQFRPIVGALAGTVLLVSLASAQDTPPPPVFQVTTLQLDPGTMIEWRDGLRKQAAAARELNLPAAEVGWWAMNDANRTAIVRPHGRDELFINPQVMQRIRAADSARAADIATSFQAGQVNGWTTEILVYAPNLSYQPATPLPDGEWGGTVTRHVYVAPGQGQAFREALQAVNAALAELEYPYARNLYWVRMGERRAQIVTFIDSRENYFGTNWIPRLWQGKAAAREALQAANRAFLKTISNMEVTTETYASGLSYPPTN